MQCSAVQCSAVQCSAVQCSAVQCSAVQCSAVQSFLSLGQLIVTHKKVVNKLNDIEDDKPPVVDWIPPKLLMEIVEQISIPLATVSNLSLDEEVVYLRKV